MARYAEMFSAEGLWNTQAMRADGNPGNVGEGRVAYAAGVGEDKGEQARGYLAGGFDGNSRQVAGGTNTRPGTREDSPPASSSLQQFSSLDDFVSDKILLKCDYILR